MSKLIPDTNFLIYLSKYKLLDKLLDYKIILLKPVLEELVSISKGNKEKKADRESAELALMFLKKLEVTFVEKIEGKADDAILEKASKEKCLVGTMDRGLIERLKKEKAKILVLRQKKFLEEK
jgi:rRNA-processing protein FCF1